jgi:glycine/D-amino acid oxidase-like deaminating enzyme
MRHVPYWLDRLPRSRRPSYPRLKGRQETRVAVVGGGLTGAACALAFSIAGHDVVLLEAGAVGGGATAGADGLLREALRPSFEDVAARYGIRAARALSEGMRLGSREFAATLRRLEVRCDLAPVDLLTIARDLPESTKQLRRDQTTRKNGGAPGSWVTPAAVAREAALESGGAIRTHAAAIDPYRACLGLLTAAASRGALIHERSAVTRIRPSARSVEIATAAGSLTADTVVVATGSPIPDLRPLRRHLSANLLYSAVTEPLPAAVKRQVGGREAAIEDADGEAGSHSRLLRWMGEDRVMIRGGAQREVPGRLRERALTQRTGQLMYELSLLYPAISGLQPEWSWDAPDYQTVDGLPFVGPHRNFPRHLFAFTPATQGAGMAWTAARLLVRHFKGESAKGDEAFGFGRIL